MPGMSKASENKKQYEIKNKMKTPARYQSFFTIYQKLRPFSQMAGF